VLLIRSVNPTMSKWGNRETERAIRETLEGLTMRDKKEDMRNLIWARKGMLLKDDKGGECWCANVNRKCGKRKLIIEHQG